MNSKSHLSLAGILVGLAFTLCNFGCGGGGQMAATPATPPAAITVSVSPTSATGPAGTTQQFTATVANDSANKGVTWSVSCPTAPCGSVSPTSTASGVATTYTAPTTAPAGNLTVTVTATSVSNSAISAAATDTILAPAVTIYDESFPGASTVVTPGATVALTASVSNYPGNTGVTWSLSCSPATSPCGTISPTTTLSGVTTTYTAPPTAPLAGLTVTITATSLANPAVSSSVTVTVLGVTVSVSPNTAQVEAGGTTQLTATVTIGGTNEGVNWTVSCAAAPCGSVSPATTPSGTPTTYTAPLSPPTSNLTVNVTAASVANPSASATATVTVPSITISIAPGSALLPVSSTQQFTATLENDPDNKGSTWAVTQSGAGCSPGCGTVVPSTTASGNPTTYTPPSRVPANSAVTIAATSVTDTTKTANAAITLTAGTVKLIPNSLAFGQQGLQNSSSPQTATLTNVGNTTLSIAGITITGNNPSDFAQTNTCGTSVGAGMSCTIAVTFTPLSYGSFSATVSISDTSADTPQQISLSGSSPKPPKHGLSDMPAVRSALGRSRTAAVPTPTGASSVGTRVMDLVDSTREDPFLADGGKRELLVRFWYPASFGQDCQRAEYTSPAVWSYFSQLVRAPLPAVVTNSRLNAPLAGGSHPVVVFTPGYTGTFTDYTFLFEDLASRGYIVASVDHTYEATAVQLPDGRLAKSVLGSHLDGSWRLDEKEFSSALSVRLDDLKFVLDELERMNSDPDSPFTGKLDMSRVALAGHSFGGLTAMLGVEQDSRFKAGIVIDGFLPDDSAVSPTEMPVLLLAAGRKQWSDAERRLWGQLRGPRFAVNLKGAEHVTPTDEVWLAKGAIKTCPMGAEKTIAAIRDYIAAFLDANLLDKPMDPLLAGPSSEYPDVEVITQDQLLPGKP